MAIKVLNYDQKSSTVLNAIRAEATDFFKDRVPTATADNLDKVQTAIYAYKETRNEYQAAVIDKIAFSIADNMAWNNKLSILKQAAYNYGKDIEELFVKLIKAQQYDAETAPDTLFKRYKPEILSVFHTINRTDVYPLTFDEEIFTRAFTGEDGFKDVSAALMESMNVSDEVDEFNIMKNMINGNIVEGKIAQRTVQPVVDEATARDFVVAVQDASNLFEFPRTDYNYANVVNACSKSRQVFLINTRIKGRINVDVLATSFNMEKAEFSADMEITMDDFGQDSDKVIGMLADKKWFQMRDRYRDFEEVRNQMGIYTNRFYHVHQSISSSPFYNAIIFIETTPTLTAIDVVPSTATVAAGEAKQFTAEATGTNYPPSKCTWEHDGTSDKTFITETGLLVVGVDEVTTPITVTATSTFNVLISDTATVTVI